MSTNGTNIVIYVSGDSTCQFKCPFPNCSSSYNHLNTLRFHAKDKHEAKVKYKAKVTNLRMIPKDPKLARKATQARVAKHRKNKVLKRAQMCESRSCYSKEEARKRGLYHPVHTRYKDDLLECKQSTLGKTTGNGVFAREDLKVGDYITIVHGTKVNKNDDTYGSLKKTHLFQLRAATGALLLGLDKPERGKGLGSFIQRGGADVLDATRYKRKCEVNCKFVYDGEDIYMKVTQSITQGRELFMSYGQGVTV